MTGGNGSKEVTEDDLMTTTTATTLSEEELKRLKYYAKYDPMDGVKVAAGLGSFFIFLFLLFLYKTKFKGGREKIKHPSAVDLRGSTSSFFLREMTSLANGVDPEEIQYNRTSSFFRREASTPVKGVNPEDEFPRFCRTSAGSGSSMSLPKSLPLERPYRQSMNPSSSPGSLRGVRRLFRLGSSGSSSDGAGCDSVGSRGSRFGPRLEIPFASDRPVLRLPSPGDSWTREEATQKWVTETQCIDINVIQPTPNMSPCGSIRTLTDSTGVNEKQLLQAPTISSSLSNHRLSLPDGLECTFGITSTSSSDSVFFNFLPEDNSPPPSPARPDPPSSLLLPPPTQLPSRYSFPPHSASFIIICISR